MTVLGITGLSVLYDEQLQHYAEKGFLMPADQWQQHDDDDVPATLERETQDGSGFEEEDELPPSDFESFSQDEVENDHDGDNEAVVEGHDQ